MKLIVGLGNTGKAYSETRHNIGFMVVDLIAVMENQTFKKNGKAHISEKFTFGGQDVILVKPTTFMNASGEAVQQLCSFYKIPLSDVIVVHDDMDLPVGSIRVKQSGGDGGHRGLRSIDGLVGKDYHRVRLGIDHPRNKTEGEPLPVIQYVIGKFDENEIDEVNRMILDSVDKIKKIIETT